MSEYPTPQDSYDYCNDQLDRVGTILNRYREGDNTQALVNAIRRVSWAVSQLNEHLKTVDERIASLARDVEMLAGDDFGDGLPF